MSTEPGQLFATLRADVHDVLLAGPAELRRVGARRGRVRRAAAPFVADEDHPNGPPADVVYETVRLYRDGGAAQHLAEFRDQVRGCPRTGEDAYRLVKTDFAGDGSLLMAITSPGDYGGQTVTKTLL